MRKNVCVNLLLLSFVLLVWIMPSQAGTFRDDFNSATLDSSMWEVVTAGAAKASINNGQLLLESFAAPDGIILYFKQKITGDVTVECKIDPSKEDPGSLGTVGFTDGIFAPEPSPNFWVHWLAHFNFSPTTSDVFADNYPAKNGWTKAGDTIKYNAEPHVWRFELTGTTLRYLFDGKEVAKSDAINVPRYFHVSPDTYISHYFGTIAIDYVEITAPDLVVSAVSSASKLPLTWGTIKKSF
jgi:hypothetical protein